MKRIQILVSSLFLALTITISFAAQAQEKSFIVKVMGTGKDMILIPGLVSDERVWETILEPLSSQYRLHLVSLAGFSGNPPMLEPSLLQVKQELLAYISAQGLDRPIVMGHSVGGFLAMWMATEKDSPVGPIISIDGLPFYAPTLTQNSETQASDMLAQARQITDLYTPLNDEQLIQMAQQSMYIQTLRQENIERITAMIQGSDGATVGNTIATLLTTDLRLPLGSITQPLLLLGAGGAAAGTLFETKMMEIYTEQLAAQPRAQLQINWDSGHFITFDEPAWLLKQMQSFLGAL